MTTVVIAFGAVWILMLGFVIGICTAAGRGDEQSEAERCRAEAEWADELRDLDWKVTL